MHFIDFSFKMAMEKYMFTLNQPDQKENMKDFLKDYNENIIQEMELDAGVSVLFIVKSTKDTIDKLKEEYPITLYNGKMQLKQII